MAAERPRAPETRMKRIIYKSVLATTALCLFGNLFAKPAAAGPSATDKSIAVQLFEEGRALLEQGRIEQACPKLEESQRLDPGGGTLLNVALCHERQGRTATAWVEFVEARGVAKADDRPLRVAFAQTHIAQLEPSLSRVIVQVASGSDVPDLEIKRDGTVIGRAAWGSAMPVDPGDHVVEAAAPGKISWKQSLVVSPAGDTKTVVVPALLDGPAHATATSTSTANSTARAVLAPVPAPSRAASVPAGTGDAPPARAGSGLTTTAWVALGLGVVGAGVSTYFGLQAISLKNDADRECPNDACTADGASQNHDAIRAADIATGAAAVGIVGIGVGAVLLVMSGATHESRPAAQLSPAPTLVTCDVSGGLGRGEVTVRARW